MTQCGITSSELETLAMDRTSWRSTCKSAVEEFEVYDAFRSWRPNGICANLVHHPPETSSARSATGCSLTDGASCPQQVTLVTMRPVVSTAQSMILKDDLREILNHFNKRCTIVYKQF